MYNDENDYYDQHDSDEDDPYETETDESDDEPYETREQVTLLILRVCFSLLLLDGCLLAVLLLLSCALHCVGCTFTCHCMVLVFKHTDVHASTLSAFSSGMRVLCYALNESCTQFIADSMC
jgi:hypothetical protein